MKILLKILIHAIFWLVFLLFNYVFNSANIFPDSSSTQNTIPLYSAKIVWAVFTFYLFYWLIIRIFEKRRFIKYLAISVFLSVIITISFLIVLNFTFISVNASDYKLAVLAMIGTFIIAQCGSLVKGFESWFSNMQLRVELENLNLRNELELLKAQINPHFLFNTLNNIDSLIFKSPDKASKALITLSEMLRYMTYDTKQDFVRLEKEIDYIQSYILLQKMRFKDQGYVSFEYNDKCKEVEIAPVLLLVFIENSFKYSFKIDKLPVIDIKLFCTDNELSFYCKNYFNPGNALHERTGGVGLANVKRRLEILYPNRHILTISSENSTFIVDLKIKLL
jgi:two-component system, LytTR family, sensor kinase